MAAGGRRKGSVAGMRKRVAIGVVGEQDRKRQEATAEEGTSVAVRRAQAVAGDAGQRRQPVLR